MTMTDNERYELICKPTLQAIKEGQDDLKELFEDLHHTIAVSNGKPSLLSRVDNLEKAAAAQPEPKPTRSVKFGPIELTGYGLNDISRAAVVVCVLWLVFKPVVQPLLAKVWP
jgi:hypothetical protein